MKKNVIMAGAAMVCAMVLASCGSSKESAYRKAYEKAKAQETAQQSSEPTYTQQVTPQAPVVTELVEAPAQTYTAPATTTTPATDASVRSESLSVVSGAGLKAYSVVVGSFGVKTNAESLQSRLNAAGYQAQVAYSAQTKMYRVVATTSDSKAAAVESRNSLQGTYPGAWLLFNK